MHCNTYRRKSSWDSLYEKYVLKDCNLTSLMVFDELLYIMCSEFKCKMTYATRSSM